MTPPLAASAYEIVLPIHILAVVIAFGVTFAYPIIFAIGARQSPRSLPLLHRITLATERILVNGGLVIVLGAGIFLASDGHHWNDFFVQWGIGAVVVIGALVGAVMIPASKRAMALSERDIAAAGDGEVEMSAEYQAIVQRLNIVGTALSALVIATIFIMAIKP